MATKQPTRTEATILAILNHEIRDCEHWLQLARQAGDNLECVCLAREKARLRRVRNKARDAINHADK